MKLTAVPPCSRSRALRSGLLHRLAAAVSLFALAPAAVSAATYYVATTGSDSNPGTLAAPFASVNQAQIAASSGDTVLVRGGTYANLPVINSDTNYHYAHQLTKSGITYAAYPGEVPTWNFSNFPVDLRVCGFQITGTGVVIRGFQVTGTPVGTQKQSECFRVEGNSASCDFYDCVAHDNQANGFYFITGSTGSCNRCDSYNNIGPTSDNIGNTDGFGAHANGVQFHYCRSWHNSDDGFDCLTSTGSNTFDHCWAYNMTAGGDSNGFKVGGYATGAVPLVIPVHTVMYCLSANNNAHGFYANHQPGQAATWTHNTAYNDAGGDFDMLERTLQPTPTDAGTDANDISGYREVLHFNIAYLRALTADDADPAANETNNSWSLGGGIVAQASDFASLDATQMTGARVGGLMPFITFMHVTSGSPLNGLGAFDPPPAAPTGLTAGWVSAGEIDLSWTAVPGAVSYNVKRSATPGGPYTIIATAQTATTYADTSIPAGTSFYYVVTAMNATAFDDSASSNEAAAIQGPAAIVTGVNPDTGRSATDGITNAPALMLTGTASDTAGAVGANSTITVSRVGVGVIGTTVADGSGHWTFDYTGTSLADGAYAFTAAAANGGYVGLASAPFNVVVDTAAPAAPTIASAQQTPVLLEGTAEANSIVTVTRVGFGVVGSATADGSGNWSYTSTESLPPGPYSYTATATDVAGNTGPVSAALAFDSSVAVPAITAIAGDNGISNSDGLTNDSTLVISGTAVAGSTVNVTRLGTGVIGSAIADGSGQWSFDYTGTTLPDGSYVFQATENSGGGMSLDSANFPVTIDTVVPVVSSIVRLNPSFANVTSAITSLVYQVTFTKPVYNVAAGQFTLTTTGSAAGVISGVSAVNGTTFNVTVSSPTGEGNLRVDLTNASGTLIDAAGNAAPAYTGGQAYSRVDFSLGSGTWTQPATGGLWSNENNWLDFVIADGGAGISANFSTLDITSTNTVHLDTARSVNSLTFGDTAIATAASWIVDNNGNAANTLTLAGASPTITVGVLGTGATTTISAVLAGTAGLTKAGGGTLILTGANTLTGPVSTTTTTASGALRLGAGGSLTLASPIAVAAGTTMAVDGGTFSTSGASTVSDGDFLITSGAATFSGGLTVTGNKDVIIQLTTGTLTATDINILRSSDSTVNFGFGLIISGGTASLGTLELGSGGSNGFASVQGGTLNVAGPVLVGNQTTSARGGGIQVTSGTFSAPDTTSGLILSKVNGANIDNIATAAFSGGTSTLGKITLGFDNTVTAGSGTVTISGGTVYIGSGGIVKNGTSGMTSTITLSSGTLGAAASWSSSHPIANSGSATIKTADASNNPFNIALSGLISGTGALTKSGNGTLTLSGANTRTGVLTLSAGTVSVPTLANGGTASGIGQAALAATNLVLNGGALQYTGPGVSINRLFSLGVSGGALDASGTGALTFNSATALTISGTGNRTLTLTGTDADANTLAPPIPNPSSGTTAVVKSGPGTWVLTGAKTYTGTTTVTGGTLLVNGSITSAVTDSAGTFGGSGTSTAAVTIGTGSGPGAILAAGNAAVGTFTTTGPLTLNADATYAVEFNSAAATFDKTGANGVTLANAVLALTDVGGNAALPVGSSYTIVDNGGSAPVSGTFLNLPEGANIRVGANLFRISYLGGTGNDIVLTVVVSPFTAWVNASGLPVSQRGPAADPDGDGLPNVLEFALNLNPTTPGSDGSATGIVTVGALQYPSITFVRQHNLGDVTVQVWVSASLDFTTQLGSVEISATPRGDGSDTVVTRSAVPLSVQPHQFFRIVASQP